MNSKDSCRYRGYQIVLRQHSSQWCVSVYPLRADLPILSSSTLRVRMPRKDEVVAAARRRIDCLLAQTV
jgi:hypothetical protein